MLGTEALKTVLLLNGGGAIGLMTFLGNLVKSNPASVPVNVGFFGAMIAFAVGTSMSLAYLTQLRLYHEAVGLEAEGGHTVYLNTCIALVFAAIAAFCAG